MIHVHPMREEKKEVCLWQYPKEYAQYDLPSYEECRRCNYAFVNPAKRHQYHAYYEGTQLIGFANIQEEAQEVYIGIGVHPAYCNQGYGTKLLQMVDVYCQSHFPHKLLYLEVRTWNKRAIACYQKAGFRIQGSSFTLNGKQGKATYYRMVKERS